MWTDAKQLLEPKTYLQSILNLADVRQRLELRIFEPENVHDPNLVLVVVAGEKWIDFEHVAETVAK